MRQPLPSAAHHAHYSRGARLKAVECYSRARDKDEKARLKAAAAILFREWSPSWGRKPRKPTSFIARHAHKLMATGSVDDAPRPGGPRKMTKEQDLRAKDIFIAGYKEERKLTRRGPAIVSTIPFAGIGDALRRSLPLAALRAAAGVSQATLWRHILEADPTIHRASVDYKRALTQQQMDARVASADDLLARWAADPGILQRLVFVDEGSAIIPLYNSPRRVAYVSRRSPLQPQAVSPPLLPNGAALVVRFYVAVNALVGGLMAYPTTGTTGLQRLYRGLFPGPPEGFKVRAQLAGSKSCGRRRCALMHAASWQGAQAWMFVCSCFCPCFGVGG